jgi:hypothetical protein
MPAFATVGTTWLPASTAAAAGDPILRSLACLRRGGIACRLIDFANVLAGGSGGSSYVNV